MKPRYLCRIFVGGDPKVGKTSLIRRYLYDEFNVVRYCGGGATAWWLFVRETSIGNSRNQMNCRLIIIDWNDLLGNTEGKSFFENPAGIILVFDMTRPETLHSIESWIDRFNEETVQRVPIILAGNKCDLETKVDRSDIERISQSRSFLEVSAKTDQNVDSLFKEVTMAAYERKTMKEVS